MSLVCGGIRSHGQGVQALSLRIPGTLARSRAVGVVPGLIVSMCRSANSAIIT